MVGVGEGEEVSQHFSRSLRASSRSGRLGCVCIRVRNREWKIVEEGKF